MTQTISTAPLRAERKKHQPTLGELVFWPTFILLMVIHCMENTTLNYYKPGWMPAVYLYRNILYGVLFLKIAFLTTYRRKELWWVLGALVVAVLCWRSTRDLQMIEWATIAIAAKDIPKQKLLYAFLLVKSVAIAMTLFLHEVGILPTLYYLNGNGPIYNTMGFCHRNVLGANMAVLCLGWFYLRFRQIGTMDILFWVVLSAVTYFLAISRTGLIVMLMIIAVMCLARKLEHRLASRPWTPQVFVGILAGLFLLCLLGAILYREGVPFWDSLNELLTKRLSFSHQVLEDFGLRLFGQDLPFVTTMAAQTSDAKPLILDNSYMRAILYFGLIPGLSLLGLMGLSLWRAGKRDHISLVACLLVMAVFGVSESYLLDVFYNFPLLLSITLLFRRPTRAEAVRPVEYALEILRLGLQRGKQLLGRTGG
ncbi:MAG: hypothetical protein II290_01100 [Oscillospiraceae bacterium]|nr:hypothetical protein [Oscillospiraceae bacterium]